MPRAKVAILLMLWLGLVALGWADDKIKLKNTQLTPAATGELSYHHDQNGNTSMELKVWHLAKPQNLTPAKNAYVVWVQGRGKPPENKGVLKVTDDLKGDLKMVTPYNDFDLLVTAEDTGTVSQPSTMEVLRGSVQH